MQPGVAVSSAKCGATAEATCDCHVDYKWAPGERARKAVEANPDKSDRGIAAEIGVSSETVRRARQATATNVAVEERTGLDGKVRKTPTSKPKVEFPSLAKIDVASALKTEANLPSLSAIERQHIEAVTCRLELRYEQVERELKAQYKQYYKQTQDPR